jgi:pantetheine-phosphate adenylyltransferase
LKGALYPGSFDPMTIGHVDIARRAARLFDRLVVGVYDTPNKNLLFDTASRVELAKGALADLPNVEVLPYTGLTVEFAAHVGAVAIVRGLRAVSDFEIEMQMAHQHRSIRPEIEVVCLMTSPNYSFLSATLIKEVARLGGDVSTLLPPNVAQALRQRFAEVPPSDNVPRFLSS